MRKSYLSLLFVCPVLPLHIASLWDVAVLVAAFCYALDGDLVVVLMRGSPWGSRLLAPCGKTTISETRCGATDSKHLVSDCRQTFQKQGVARRITPQAIFVPELPDGWVVKSSG